MEGTIAHSNCKVFSKGLRALAVLGLDLSIEQTDVALVFRTLNNTQSSFAQMTLSFTFFDGFSYDKTRPIRCKLNIRNLVFAVRSLSLVERIYIKLDPQKNIATMEFESLNKIRRNFHFNFEDQSHTLQADFSRQICPNLLVVEAASLNTCLINFHSSVEEISLLPRGDSLLVKSHHEVSTIQRLQTEYLMDASDFLTFRVDPSVVEVSCGLKEIRMLLNFCEATHARVHIFFDHGGAPILLSNSLREDSFTCTLDLIVSTLQLDADAIDRLRMTTSKPICLSNTRILANASTADLAVSDTQPLATHMVLQYGDRSASGSAKAIDVIQNDFCETQDVYQSPCIETMDVTDMNNLVAPIDLIAAALPSQSRNASSQCADGFGESVQAFTHDVISQNSQSYTEAEFEKNTETCTTDFDEQEIQGTPETCDDC